MELPDQLLNRFDVKRRKRMDEIDQLPRELRELVHEFNWSIVKAFLDSGVRDARKIRHLIRTVANGAAGYGSGRQLSSGASMKISTHASMELSLRDDLVLSWLAPTEDMVRASMAAVLPYVPGTPLLSKVDKHRIRLSAALRAAKDQGIP